MTRPSEIFIHEHNASCALGTDRAQIARNFFDPAFVPVVEEYVNSAGKITQLFPFAGERLAKRVLGRDLSFNCHVALAVLEPLLPAIHAWKRRLGRERVGLVLGTSTSGISDFEFALQEGSVDLSEHLNAWVELGDLTHCLARKLDVAGPCMTISTACSSGGMIFIEACRLLQSGFCDAVVVGACDTLSLMIVNGFQSLGATAPERTNPFSVTRQGMNLGEAAAFFVLTKEVSDLRIAGFGESIDAFHISSPEPSGKYAEKAILDALSAANLQPSGIGYVNLHGTGTLKNDEMEGELMARIFGAHPIISSTKPYTGHALGTAGALEVLLCCLILQNQFQPIPRQYMVGQSQFPDLRFSNGRECVRGDYCMSNSFAFGGSNASIIIGRH